MKDDKSEQKTIKGDKVKWGLLSKLSSATKGITFSVKKCH